MVVLSLDTTTRTGSAALWRDGRVLELREGDRTRTHGQRLPRELLDLLSAHAATVADVDLFAVAAGPGSFTGLRVGIATIQGLAFATNRPVVGVSTLDALGLAGYKGRVRGFEGSRVQGFEGSKVRPLLAVWMDALRDEVFSALYDAETLAVVDAAAVDRPERTLERWRPFVSQGPLQFVGDGATRYSALIEDTLRDRVAILPPPPLAGLIAEIAVERAAAGEAGPPHAIRPIYVRRPDAELARDRSTPAP